MVPQSGPPGDPWRLRRVLPEGPFPAGRILLRAGVAGLRQSRPSARRGLRPIPHAYRPQGEGCGCPQRRTRVRSSAGVHPGE
eukprot:9939943-Alexandrium_andersonii.AAC.1